MKYIHLVQKSIGDTETCLVSIFLCTKVSYKQEKLTLILLTWRIWWAPDNASKWQMGFNLAFNPCPANVEKMASS